MTNWTASLRLYFCFSVLLVKIRSVGSTRGIRTLSEPRGKIGAWKGASHVQCRARWAVWGLPRQSAFQLHQQNWRSCGDELKRSKQVWSCMYTPAWISLTSTNVIDSFWSISTASHHYQTGDIISDSRPFSDPTRASCPPTVARSTAPFLGVRTSFWGQWASKRVFFLVKSFLFALGPSSSGWSSGRNWSAARTWSTARTHLLSDDWSSCCSRTTAWNDPAETCKRTFVATGLTSRVRVWPFSSFFSREASELGTLVDSRQ